MKIEDWGLIEYESAVKKQEALVEEVANGGEERIVFCTHPPVVTLGRATTKEDIEDWRGAVFESSRGGRATYHGPSQLVIYPILDLKRKRKSFAERDIHAYLRALENAVVTSLNDCGLEAEIRTAKMGEISLTGVWVGEHKIASLGIAIRKWTTYHGAAINVLDDEKAFKGINPCGFKPTVMTSIERETGKKLSLSDYQALCEKHLKNALSPA